MFWGKEHFVKLKTDYGKVKFSLKNYKEAQVIIATMIKNKEWTKVETSNDDDKPKMYSGIFNKIEKDLQKINVNAQKVGESFTSFDALFGNLREINEAMKEMKKISHEDNSGGNEVNSILK